MEVLRLVLTCDLGELQHDVRKSIAIPERRSTVHWRTNEDPQRRSCGTKGPDLAEEIVENLLRPKDCGAGSRGRGRDVVRDARHDASVGDLTSRLQGGLESGETTTMDDLSLGQEPSIHRGAGGHVAPDVGVADQREARQPKLIRHLDKIFSKLSQRNVFFAVVFDFS